MVSISCFLIGQEEPKFAKVDNTEEHRVCVGGGGWGGEKRVEPLPWRRDLDATQI